MAEAILSLGTNLGDRQANLEKACKLLSAHAGKLLHVSSVYETEPWGFNDNSRFLNIVAVMETQLDPFDLLDEISAIEKLMGRTRGKARYSPRIIDIDILFYNQLIIGTTRLTIPHPCIEQRLFVLIPLTEVSPHFIHPIIGQTVEAMLDQCPDDKAVIYHNRLPFQL